MPSNADAEFVVAWEDVLDVYERPYNSDISVVCMDEYADICNAITIESMLSYSPNINPIKQVWRQTRHGKTHNKYWSDLPKLIEVRDSWFFSFAKPNSKLSIYDFLYDEKINVVYYGFYYVF